MNILKSITFRRFFYAKMIDLPYPLNALEPYYSKQTLDLHYNILYKGYIDNTNKTEEKLDRQEKIMIFLVLNV